MSRGRMQDFWSPLQLLIEETCSEFDKIWQTRQRVINTQFLVFLKDNNSEHVQGSYFSPPLDAKALSDFMIKSQ